MRQLKIAKQVTNIESHSLRKYLYEISKIPRIDAEEEVTLTRKIKNGDEDALVRLVNSNLRFVISVAKQYQNKGLPLADLISEGNLGMIRAAHKFDETRGFKFISYAVWWVRQAILQALAEQSRIVRMPLNKIGNAGKVQKAFLKLEQKFMREPTLEELADDLDLKKEEVAVALKANGHNQHVSIDAPMKTDEKTSRSETLLASEASRPDTEMFNESLKKEINRSLDCLSKREAEIIRLYYGLTGDCSYSLDELGNQFDLTRERVRQIKQQALEKLEKPEHLKNLRKYLVES